MAFLVATTSLPAVYRPNGYARTTTAGKPHACAKSTKKEHNLQLNYSFKAFLRKQEGEVNCKFLAQCRVMCSLIICPN